MMNLFAWKRLVSLYLFLLVAQTLSSSAKADNVFSYLQEKYEEMPEKGRFAAGAVAGFVGSRVAVRSAVTIIKVAGAAYIATEVMNAAGVLDDIDVRLSDEQTELVQGLKRRALTLADEFRTTVRRRLNPDKIKLLMEKDRMATMGVATGAFVGFLL
eukprot:CAMPEP_0170352310 /NCGR_PEP_ID=MMETSP0116_2-20130129/77466_1 /TAXON_ID=400756 /ORGANISM="Durinskia baltica, Strain CSIRO CS-38" /LENGTH=156 /DNA_ID=CAMNT_0010606235 /DNA_START=124 /DNA_END=594 /DNA_ORIENTATION=+